MRTKILTWLLPGVAFLGLSCAPGHDQTPRPDPDGENGGARAPIDVPTGLKARIEAALANVKQRDLFTDNSFWTIFHGILGMGPQTQLLDRTTGKRINAIEYIRKGGPVRGMKFPRSDDGLDVLTDPKEMLFVGQGHQDQFVAEMVQWGLSPDTMFTVDGKAYPFSEFLRFSKLRASVTKKQELSWAIVIISQHFGTDFKWTNSAGEQLSLDDLARYEAREPIDDAACGGTHRLFGLTWAYHLHLRRGGKTEGVWKEVADRLAEQKERARKFQNRDGAFSTKYLAGLDDVKDPQRRIGTTGHVLEWLSLYLSDAELREPWVEEAANALVLLILENQQRGIESGALYHAAHGLHIYHSRLFGGIAQKGGVELPLPPGR
jgi:hypothetical protein